MGPGFSREQFAETVRENRKMAGLSQAALAEAVGVSTETISRLERGAFEPSLSTACAVAAVLGKSLDALIGEDGGKVGSPNRRDRSPILEQLIAQLEELPPAAHRALLKVVQLIPRKS